MTTARRIRTTASVFELPQKLGILQYVEYEPPPKGVVYQRRMSLRGAFIRGGVPQGVCIKYRVWVHSRDRRTWEAKSGGEKEG
ncbi:MAG: hypothetical protein AT708_00615 [Pyrobaculum sp. OCT_11]|jgi:hypothetical protein|nr:MAG: hypothetical protein AT708_00615 [Pyrobaculum sp. OCT_11]